MLLIYSAYNSPRLEYIANVLLHDLSGIDVSCTTRTDEFVEYEGPKINYSNHPLTPDELRIAPAALLSENGISSQAIPCTEHDRYKILFPAENGDLPFDIFAASFYLLAGMKNTLPHQPDEYVLHIPEAWHIRKVSLQQPLINQWLADFPGFVAIEVPFADLRRKKFRFIPTYDIDIAFRICIKAWQGIWADWCAPY